jgi:flagella basal body P-ring formation protein FlgA
MQRSTHLKLTFLFVAIAWPMQANALTEITLRERATIDRSVVRLCDVADIAGDNEAQRLKLAALPLMPAPSSNGQHFLRKREVEDLLAAHGAIGNHIRIGGANQVEITARQAAAQHAAAQQQFERTSFEAVPTNRHAAILAGQSGNLPATTLDPQLADALRQEVQQIVSNYLQAKSAGMAGEIQCDIADRHLPLLKVATSAPVCTGGIAPWTGRQRLMLSFSTAAGRTQLPVYADVLPKAVPVVVALEAIPRGAVITAAHVELQTMAYATKASDRRTPFNSVEELIGMEARQSIPAGVVVTSDQVRSPVLVKRGEQITISSQGNGIRVRTTAKALNDSAKGELVQVESLTTKERFDARVVGMREATVITVTPVSEVSTPIETARR